MPFRVRCPRCWETAEIPDHLLGRQGKCNRCGSPVSIPTQLSKACFVCGTDVTGSRHYKDGDNNYLCPGCWSQQQEGKRSEFVVPTVECSVCHAMFSQGDGRERDGRPVCKDCFERNTVLVASGDEPVPSRSHSSRSHRRSRRHRHREHQEARLVPAEPTLDAQPAPDQQSVARAAAEAEVAADEEAERIEAFTGVRPRRGDEYEQLIQRVAAVEAVATSAAQRPAPAPRPPSPSSPWPALMAGLALAGAGVLAYLHFRGPSWERQNEARVVTLKAQAEVLSSVGRHKEALERYEALMRLVDGQHVQDATLRHEIDAAKADYEKEHRAAQQAQADEAERVALRQAAARREQLERERLEKEVADLRAALTSMEKSVAALQSGIAASRAAPTAPAATQPTERTVVQGSVGTTPPPPADTRPQPSATTRPASGGTVANPTIQSGAGRGKSIFDE